MPSPYGTSFAYTDAQLILIIHPNGGRLIFRPHAKPILMYKTTTLVSLVLCFLITQAAPQKKQFPKPVPASPRTASDITARTVAPTAKYVFVLFGDGMADNLSRLTELYLSAKYKKDTLLNYSKFPQVALTTTNSKSSLITCSSAAGTAIFCGQKTKVNHIGMNEKQETLESIGIKLKKEGYKLGICSTNGIDHATPASLYAHTPERRNFFLIASQLAKSNIDFAAGAGFVDINHPSGKSNPLMLTIADSLKKYHWHVTTQKTEALQSKASKVLLLNTLTEASEDLPFSIDRRPEELNLIDFAKIGLHRLYDPNGKGFFFMLEGGSIDHAMHSNDAATAVHEVINFTQTIDVALDFYQQHPDETLLLVVSDHETGGVSLGKDGARDVTALPLLEQKVSYHKMEELLQSLHPHPDTILQYIDRYMFKISEKDIQFIKKASKQSIPESQKALYARNNSFVQAALQVMQDRCHIGFSTRRHTAARIPLFALGAGAEHFHGVIENSDIPALIYKAMGKNWSTETLSAKP